MLIDDVSIRVSAGHGGRGAVSFRKTKMTRGPNGGNGGRGGSIILEGVANLGSLDQFRFKKELMAPSGGQGMGNFVDGPDGKDLTLKVPVGTVVHNLISGIDHEIEMIGQQLLVARGGHGGKGNYKFRSATNTTPKEFQPGLPGEEYDLRLELKLIADVGFVGLPNVGKSTLLNLLTAAKSKVANYPFTTLEPNLGTYYDLILADIPGLIEGASGGKGLGHKFLRHVERTKTLFHFISADSQNIEKDYKVIKEELEKYNPELIKKPEYLILTKTDNVDPKVLKTLLTKAKKINKNVVAISMYDDKSLEQVRKTLNKILDEKNVKKDKTE